MNTSHNYKAVIIALMTISGMVASGSAEAQMKAANTATGVTTAPNGVTQVNIANPNASGLSNNLFTDYNVSAKGVILNNQDSSKLQVQSQLGGAVSANTNLTSEAKVILNQVVSTNRSTLLGYTEVVGGSADVIVANPNGITCNGCGFINISNLTLTTGAPVIANGGQGALTGFNVATGDILITGQGLDGSKTDYLALFARSLAIQGQINAKSIDIAAGSNAIDYATKAVAAQAATGTAPTLAIDSSALGGMYANTIRLIATESGVGVRMLGNASAGAGDFTLTASGKVDLENKISAQGNVNVSSADNSSADSIKLTDATVSSQGNTTLTATNGNIDLIGGFLYAQGDLSLQSTSLTDTADANSIILNGQNYNNFRYAAGAITLNQTGATTLNGTALGANGALGISSSTLNIGAGQNIESTTGNITLTSTTLTNAGTVSADTGNLTTHTSDTLTNTGTLNAGNDTTLYVLNNLTNSSNILAGNNMTISRTSTGGTHGWLQIDNNTSSGILQAGNLFTIQGVNGDHAVSLDANTGYILSNAFNVDILSLNNSSIIQSTTGASTLSVSNTLTNNSAGNINLGTTSAGSGTFNAGVISDSGIIESAGALNLNVGTSVSTAAAASPAPAGQIISAGDLTIRGLTASNYTINNSGIIQSVGGTLDIAGHGGSNAVTIQNGNGVAAALFEGHDINWNAGTINFYGNGVKADNDLTLSANTLNMTGSTSYVMAGHNGTLTFANTLSDNAVLFGTNMLTVNAPSITVTSSGALASSGTLQLNLTNASGTLDNSGALYAGSQLNVAGTLGGTLNSVTSYHGTFINEAGGTVNSSGNANFWLDTFNNTSPNFNIAGNADVNANTFSNQIPGTYTIVWDYQLAASCVANPATCFVPSEGTGITSADVDFSLIPNGAQDNRAGAQADGHNTTSGGIQVDNWQLVNLSGSSVSGAYYDDTEHVAGIPTDETARYLATFNVKQQYVGAAPTSANRPNMIVGGTLTIENFQTATNKGGDISAATINISTNKSGATFTNDDLSLKQQNWEAWWDEYSPCDDRQVDNCGWNQRSYDKWINSTQTISSFGAGIFATNLNTNGFSLVNEGSSQAYNITTKPAPTTGAGTVVSSSSANTISFGGVTVTLPTNPNGLFITNPNSSLGPLIESNPQYAVGSSFLGPNYMLQNYGVNPDTVERQLGDANYDAQLIQQQLVGLGASQLLGTTNQAAAMQMLMDNGVSQGKSMGLKIGVPPTAAQLANLSSNMVWLVDTVVNGQHVLAPVVYLSAATKSQIASGAVIQATNANMQLTSLTNTGGTISGSNKLNITTQGDITNTSGTITGGNVNLASTNGSIINQTLANFGNSTTNGDKTATISSTGDLALNAANNITNTGANISAGNNASLTAGNNITFNTINDVQTTGSSSNSHGAFGDSSTVSTTTTTTNVGSNLIVGGNLASKSGGDTTLIGSNVNVTGNGSMIAGGNLNILDAQDTTYSATTSSGSGLGVGGGVYGTQTTSDTDLKGISHGSTVHFGGNGNLTAGGDVTLRGSDAGAAGDLDVNATNVNVLAGENTDSHKHTVSTTTFGKIDGGSSDSDSGSSSGATSGTDHSNGATASADANAGASASNNDSGGLTLAETSTTTTQHDQSNAKSSNLTSGGNMTINASNDVNVNGSNVNAGGNATVNAKDVNVTAAQNTDTTSTTTTDTKIGLYGSSDNKADANADANANAAQGSMGNPTASAGANASAEATSDNTLNLASTEHSTDNVTDITHTGSSINSGGNMAINAQNNLSVNGSSLAAGGDASLNATNMSFTAAQDSHTETKTDSTTAMGLYASAGANANAGANVSAQGTLGSADASAGADANAGVGLVGTNTTSSSMNGTTTAQTSSITSGGNLTRNATNDISDEGTQINAGGDFSQSSKTWESKAAQNTTTSSSNSETNTAKAGLYADANASASASASTTGGTDKDAGASASAGLEASYQRSTDGESANSSNAVVSNIHSGGNMTTTTTGKTSLEGTNLSSGSDMTVNAGSLDYKAAQNTSSSSSATTGVNADAKVGIDATKAVNVDLSADYNSKNSSNSSSTAVVGGMTSGGNMHVNTTGDANFEGTNLNAGGSAGISAGGNVNMTAAHNTSTSSSNGLDAGGSISLSKSKDGKGAGLNANASYDTQSSNESDAVTGSVTSGKGLSVTAGKNATFEGTNLTSGGDTNVAAAGDVNVKAAQSTSSSSGYNVGGSLSMSGSTSKKADGSTEKKSGGGVDLDGGYNNSNSTTSSVSNINSGGKVNVSSGHDTNLEGTNIASTGTTSLNAGHDVNFTAATNTSSSIGVSGGIGGSSTKTTTTGAAAGSKPTTTTENDGNVNFGINGGTSSTQTGGSIKAGGIAINSGNDTTLVGTQTQSAGATTVNAGGNVNLAAAQSSDVSGGLGFSAGKSGAGVSQAGIDGGSNSQATSLNSMGDLTINSGGKTSLQGSQLSSDGTASVNAQGGTDKSSTVSGRGGVSLSSGEASLNVQQTKVISNGLTNAVATATPQLQTALSGILNNANLSTTDKFKQLSDTIKNDPSLSAADKSKMLATLATQQKNLSSGAPASP